MFEEVDRGLAVLGELLAVLDDAPELRAIYDALCRRRRRTELFVAVVGEKKAGKSTFLNAVLGARLLGAAARECTSTITTIRRGGPSWEADFVDGHVERAASIDKQPSAEDARLLELVKRAAEEEHLAVSRRDATRSDLELAVRAVWQAEVASASAGRARDSAAAVEEEQRAVVESRRLDVPVLPAFFANRALWAVVLVGLFGWAWSWRRSRVKAGNEALADAERQLLERERARVEASQAGESSAALVVAAHGVRTEAERAFEEAERSWAACVSARIVRAEAHAAHRAGWFAEDRTVRREFSETIGALTSVDARGRDVRRLALSWPARGLPEGLVFLDTPGVNTDDAENQRRAWAAIAEADGCLVVSDLQQAVSQSLLAFVGRVRADVPHLVLVLTKQDRALENAEADGEGAEAVEQARRAGTRRFAREVEQDPGSVFTLVVAAEPALVANEGLPPWEQDVADPAFAAELGRLYTFLAEERLEILAARCAAALRVGSAEVERVRSEATRATRERIAAIEAERIVDPARFRAERLAALVRSVAEGMEGEKRLARTRVELRLTPIIEATHADLASRRDRADLERWSAGLAAQLAGPLEEARRRCAEALAAGASRVHRKAEASLITSFEERYRVVLATIGPTLSAGPAPPGMPGLVSAELDLTQLAAGFGAAAAGAMLGAMLLPGIGAAIGGALGAFASRFAPQAPATDAYEAALTRWFADAQRTMVAWSDATADALRDELQAELGARLDADLARYSSWIEGLIAREEEALVAGRARLEALDALGCRLEAVGGR